MRNYKKYDIELQMSTTLNLYIMGDPEMSRKFEWRYIETIPQKLDLSKPVLPITQILHKHR